MTMVNFVYILYQALHGQQFVWYSRHMFSKAKQNDLINCKGRAHVSFVVNDQEKF